MSDVDKMERDIAEVTPLLRYDLTVKYAGTGDYFADVVEDAGGDWLRCDPEIVAIIAAAPALIARVRELEAGLREACDLIDSGSAFCSDCDRGATAESLRALLPKETP